MAETYETPFFQNNVGKPPVQQPAAPAAQTGGQQTGGQQTGGGETYETPAFKQGGGNQGGGAQTGEGQEPSRWDLAKVAGNEALVGLPSLLGAKQNLDAARARLGPVGSAGADMLGAGVSPTQLLNFFGGPEVAGAVHEGIKSAADNWNTNESWPQYGANVLADTALGGATGGFGRAAAKGASVAAPVLTRIGVQGGIPGTAAMIGHNLFGQGDVYREVAHMAPEFASMFALDEFAKKMGQKAGGVINSPTAQQAVKSVIMGAGSAARTAAGPDAYNSWIPGQ